MLIILPYSIVSYRIPYYLILSHASRPYLMVFFYPNPYSYPCSTLLHSTPPLLYSTLCALHCTGSSYTARYMTTLF